MKFYIAFSIHDSRKFRVATINTRLKKKKLESEDSFIKRALGEDFFVIKSRRVSYDVEHDGIKVGWNKLNNKAGKPLASNSWVSRRFKELMALGWVLMEDAKQR